MEKSTLSIEQGEWVRPKRVCPHCMVSHPTIWRVHAHRCENLQSLLNFLVMLLDLWQFELPALAAIERMCNVSWQHRTSVCC